MSRYRLYSLAINCICYFSNRIVDESSTDYISSAARSYITSNKCVENVLVKSVIIATAPDYILQNIYFLNLY